MNRNATLGILVGGVILFTAASASAQVWGRPAVPRSGACFYEHIDFGGRYLLYRPRRHLAGSP